MTDAETAAQALQALLQDKEELEVRIDREGAPLAQLAERYDALRSKLARARNQPRRSSGRGSYVGGTVTSVTGAADGNGLDVTVEKYDRDDGHDTITVPAAYLADPDGYEAAAAATITDLELAQKLRALEAARATVAALDADKVRRHNTPDADPPVPDLALVRATHREADRDDPDPTPAAAELAATRLLAAAAELAATRAKFSFTLDDAYARLGLDADKVRRHNTPDADPPVPDLALVRATHREADRDDPDPTPGWCFECAQQWPCVTIQLADTVDRLHKDNVRVLLERSEQTSLALALQADLDAAYEAIRSSEPTVMHPHIDGGHQVSYRGAAKRLTRHQWATIAAAEAAAPDAATPEPGTPKP